MRVLVTAASTHGSTAQIAEVIVDVVRSSGHGVVVEEPSSVYELGAFDACVVRAREVPEPDYRDGERVRRWSLGVLTQLDALQASSAAGPGT